MNVMMKAKIAGWPRDEVDRVRWQDEAQSDFCKAEADHNIGECFEAVRRPRTITKLFTIPCGDPAVWTTS